MGLDDELQALRATYDAMVENAPEAIVAFDLDDGSFVEANRQACLLFGLSREELLKRGPIAMSPERQPDGRLSSEAAMEAMGRALEGEFPIFEWVHVNAEGEEILVRIQLSRVQVEGKRIVRGRLVDIREQREVEEARRRLRAIADATPDIIAIADAQGRAMYVNPAARRLLGMGDDEALEGQSIADVHSPEWAKFLLEEALPTAVREGVWQGETEFRARDGSILPASQVLVAHMDAQGQLAYVSTIARDIRETKAAQKAERRFREILDTTPNLVGMVDATGGVLYVNAAARRLVGLGLEEDITGRDVADFVVDPVHVVNALQAAIRDGVWRGETDFRAASGAVVPTDQIILAHRGDDGEVEYFSSIAVDITERRKAEKLQQKMQQAQKLESLGMLAGGIAHDFNNILVGILGNAALAIDDGDPSSRRESLQQIQVAARRAADLAQQMLAYAGQAQPTMAAVQLPELVQDVTQLIRASIKKGVKVVLERNAAVPAIIGDATQLRQVLMNLLINASDAIESEGTVRIRIDVGRPSELQHDHLVEGPANRVLLEVSDTGRGIDAPIEQIFDPFFTTKFTGRGLGLAAVLGILRAHEGAIGVETGKHGTTFRLWFTPAPGATIEESAGVDDEGFKGSGTILIVDDEDMVRRVLRLSVERLGFEVIEAPDGASGEAKFREHSGSLRAVILDLTMPGRSGAEVMKTLRELDAEVPIVLTSGYSEDATEADAFLPKPFRPADVAELLQTLLES